MPALSRKVSSLPSGRYMGCGATLLLLSVVGCVEGQYRSPTIIEHPADVLVGRDEPATLNCHADGRPEPSITWYKDGRPLQSSTAGGRHLVLASGDLFFLQVHQDDTTDDAGIYWCVAANSVATARSNNATLEIAVLGTEFAVVPRDSRVVEGEVALLECRPPAGSPTPVVTWLRDGRQLDPAVNHRYRVSPSGDLVVTSVSVGDGGRYTCQARNAYATRSASPATLAVLVRPHLVSSSGSVMSSAGSTVELVCRVGGDPPPEVFWGRIIPAGAQLPLERLVQEERGQVLRLRLVSSDDQGVYSCTAENPAGIVAANTSLTVLSRPVFNTMPKDARVGVGGTARFECSVTGSPEPSTYWTHEGSGLLASVGQAWADGRVRVGADNCLNIGGVREEDTGYYACVAVGEAGSAIARAHLEVQGLSDMPPPIIAVGATNQTLPLHTEAQLPCETRGTPEPTVTWSKDGRLLDTALITRHSVTPLGTLRIRELQQSDSGLYTCTATNIAGSSQWQAALAVHKATNPNIRFVKMFWDSDLPDPPENITILAVNETQVTLGWSRGRSGSSSVRGHSVQYWSPDLRGPWMDAATVTPNHLVDTPWATTVTSLMPNTRYVLTVRSRNKDWVSRPSVFTHVIRTLDNGRLDSEAGNDDSVLALRDVRNKLSSPTVRLVSVEATSSTSLKVSWRVLVNDPDTLEGVYVRHRLLDPNTQQPVGALSMETVHFSLRGERRESALVRSSNAGQSNALSSLLSSVKDHHQAGGVATSHTITNLGPSTGYQVFVVPFYRNIEGLPTAAMRRTTLPAPVLPAPTGLHYTALNGSAVRVEWDPLPLILADSGSLNGYNIQVLNVAEVSHSLVLNTTTNATFVLLLLPTEGATYELTVRGATSLGHGPPSKVLNLKTFWKSTVNEIATNDILIPSTTDGSSTNIIIAIISAAGLVFCLLFAAVVWIFKKRNFAKCPHYFTKEDCSSGPWSAYSGCWEDGTNRNGIPTTRYNDGTVSVMNNVRSTNRGDTLLGVKSGRWTKNGDSALDMNASLYCSVEGQLCATAQDKRGYDGKPAEDLLYEDPEGLRLVSFKGCHNRRCTSPEPYATTPLITAEGESAPSYSIKGGMRLPPNVPHMSPLDAAHNFNAHTEKGPVLQFPNPALPHHCADGNSTTASYNPRAEAGNHTPSQGCSCHHLLLQHLPHLPSTGSNNPPTGGSISSRLTSPSLHPRHNRTQVSSNNISAKQIIPNHLIIYNNDTNNIISHVNHLFSGASPGVTMAPKSVDSPERCSKVAHAYTRSGSDRRLGGYLTDEETDEGGIVCYPSSNGMRCSSPPEYESDFTKGNESCWSSNDEYEGSTSEGGSVCSQHSMEASWEHGLQSTSTENWKERVVNKISEETDGSTQGTSHSLVDKQKRNVRRKLSAESQSRGNIGEEGETVYFKDETVPGYNYYRKLPTSVTSNVNNKCPSAKLGFHKYIPPLSDSPYCCSKAGKSKKGKTLLGRNPGLDTLSRHPQPRQGPPSRRIAVS